MDQKKQKTKRGRKPLVDLDIVFNALEKRKHDLFNELGCTISVSEKVWYEISRELGGKLSPTSIFLTVFHNRNNFQTKLKNLLGIIPTNVSLDQASDDESSCNESSSISNTSSVSLNSGRKLFKFNLTYDLFRTIFPNTVPYKRKTKIRNYDVLKQNMWADVINDAFLSKHKLPCNFIYKRAKVFSESGHSKHYITFSAKCKDKCCGSNLYGWSDFKPKEGEPLEISVLTKNTIGLETKHTTKRPLRGEKRKTVGDELENDLACNWRRKNVSDLEFGNVSPPNLYRNDVLRKVKQEVKDKKLGIYNKCPIQSLIELKHNSAYSGFIHFIAIDPFIVHYWSKHQLAIYKDLSKTYCKLSIDATGSLIKKLKRSSINILSSHIFLYEAVVSSNNGNISITQMLSEKQDTLTIFYWLGQWMMAGPKNPNEVVCDYSKAILGAISRAFCNGSSLKMYVDDCFDVLKGLDEKLPATYIRIDVAHVIKIFCRIKHLTGIKNKALKEFYVRGLRLLLSSETLDEFTRILEALLTVVLSETDGWCDGSETLQTPSERCRQFILEKIRGISSQSTFMNDNEVDDTDKILNYSDEKEDDNGIWSQQISKIEEYLKEIYERSKLNSETKGNRLSAYFLPDLATNILRLCKDFPVWTNVMRNKFNSPYDVASSAVVENDFKELKTQILKHDVRPMTVDRFLIKHICNIEANAKLLKSSLIRTEASKQAEHDSSESLDETINYSKKHLTIQSKAIDNYCREEISINSPKNEPSICSDTRSDINDSDTSLNAVENWRGQGNDQNAIEQIKTTHRKKRSTKYMSSMPEIDKLLNSKHLRSNLNSLILNGNTTTPVRLGKDKYIVYNTCPFDSVVVMLSMAYIDIPSYKYFVDANDNELLIFAKQLANQSSGRSLYNTRVSIIRKIFHEDEGITNLKVIDARCNVSFIITNLLKTAPSSIEDIVCSKMDCTYTKTTTSSPTIILRLRNEFSTLQNAMHQYVDKTYYECPDKNCDGVITSVKYLQNHIFIEADIIAEEQQFSLYDFPVEICVNSEKFRLRGAIGYGFDHYIGYVRRADGIWEAHNDLRPKIEKIKTAKNHCINPHIIFYVKL